MHLYRKVQRLTRGMSVPISVDDVARRLGLRVRYGPYAAPHDGDVVAGCLIRDRDADVIGVNSSQPLTRQRFTVAHMIGHEVLRHDVGLVHLDRHFRSTESIERQANLFAALLLVPRWCLSDYDVESAELPADQFGVSPLVMALAAQHYLADL